MKKQPWDNAPSDFAESFIKHAHNKKKSKAPKASVKHVGTIFKNQPQKVIVRTTTALENVLPRDKKTEIRIEVALNAKTKLSEALLAITEEMYNLEYNTPLALLYLCDNPEKKTTINWDSIETRHSEYNKPRSKDIKSKHYLVVSGTRDILPAEKEELKKRESEVTTVFKKASLERAIANVKRAGYTVTAKPAKKG